MFKAKIAVARINTGVTAIHCTHNCQKQDYIIIIECLQVLFQSIRIIAGHQEMKMRRK